MQKNTIAWTYRIMDFARLFFSFLLSYLSWRKLVIQMKTVQSKTILKCLKIDANVYIQHIQHIWKIWILHLLWVLYFKLVNTFFFLLITLFKHKCERYVFLIPNVCCKLCLFKWRGKVVGKPWQWAANPALYSRTMNGETFLRRQATLRQLQAETNQLGWAHHYNS